MKASLTSLIGGIGDSARGIRHFKTLFRSAVRESIRRIDSAMEALLMRM